MIELKRGTLKHKWLNFRCRFISIKKGEVYIGRGSSLQSKYLRVESGTRVNGSINIKGSGEVRIGHFCAIGDGVRMISSNHDMKGVSLQLHLQRRILKKALIDQGKIDVVIGNDVWIGDLVILLPGVVIADGAVIGAGSVVTKSVSAYSVVGGCPARVIGTRFSKGVSQRLQEIRWWNWNWDEMCQNKLFFAREFGNNNSSDIEFLDSLVWQKRR